MRSVRNELYTLFLIGTLLGCSSVRANVNGDIVSFKSDQANTTYTVSGSTIDFKIALSGKFALTNSNGGTLALMPELRMTVNGDASWASLYAVSQYKLAGVFDRTDVIYRYTVQTGDMAQPLRIYATPTIPYQFVWNGWGVRNSLTTSNAVWKFNAALSVGPPDEVYDIDLAKANITIKTLSFDETHSPVSVAATDSTAWRVTSVNPVVSEAVDFYVWTPETNILQIGSVPNQAALLVSMPIGVTQVDFPIRGLAVGTTDIYLQRTADYQTNAILGVTNYIRRAITVTAPPEIQTVATPVFIPPSGTQGTNVLAVAINNATEGATIRYTLDGSAPTAASPEYMDTITLTESATVKAKAFKSGMDESATASATYVVVPDFDIVDVRVLCKDKDGTYSATRFQPLVSDAVGVEARLDNYHASPSNIQMYVTYYIGTNVWGVDHWPVGQTVTKPMYPTLENPLVYRTSPADDIPVQEQDQVVQYRVWSSYLGESPFLKQQEIFDNPTWYYPTDLNQTFAAQGWSPYYIVYGVPSGAVWINEVNATDLLGGIGENRYIEIAVPVGVDLAGWQVDLVTAEDYSTRTIQIPVGSGLTKPDAYTTNGYAFFVIGEDSNPAMTNLNYGYPGLTEAMPRILPGGLRLRRPQGMYEQAIAYDWYVYDDFFSGPIWAANDPQHRFVYVGTENNGGSLSITNGTGAATNDWRFPLTWTPGWPNSGQAVPSAEVTLQGVEVAATLVFAPLSGTSGSNTLAVTLTSETAGVTIRYTLDGSEPTTESAAYTGAITISQSVTLKAKAFKSGMLRGATAIATYTIIVPEFDLVDVKVLCKDSDGTYSTTRTQPLDSDAVGVEARIANAQMSPSNISMFVSYYVGTNVWGVDHWPLDEVVTKPMVPTEENPLLYRTSPSNDIPAQGPDQVVQYRVWASYWVGVVPRTKQQDTFENPSIFYQADLNERFVSQGWSPYYIVYGPSGGAAWPLDIVSIRSDQANSVCTASGTIDFKITLAGKFQLVNVEDGSFTQLPEIRLIVNGDVAFASLYSLNQYKVAAGNGDRTDFVFRYNVRSGDMAQPLQIFGPPQALYQINWNGWEARDVITDRSAVWKFNTGLSLPSEGEVCDPNLIGANITVRTLSFDEAHSPNSLTAKAEATWRVTTINPVAGDGVDFYVWTPGTNLLQIGAMPNQTALLVNLPAGATQVDFPIRGFAVGTTDIYLQRVKDYQNNSVFGVTNAIRRTLTLIAPPPPLIRVVMTDNGTDTITMNESASPSTGSFQIELSEAFTNDVWVRMDTVPVGQSNVTFDASSSVIRIPAGSLVSPVSSFSVPDGFSRWSSGSPYNYAVVTMTPTVTNADAAATYTRGQSGTVNVRNVPPVLLQPLNGEVRTVQRGMPFSIDWAVSDVPADQAGIVVNWDFGGSYNYQPVNGTTGQIVHSFATSGYHFVTVKARDKDGEYSATAELLFKVEQPTVSVVAAAAEYSETETNNTGSLMVYLSTAYTEDVWVKLSATRNGNPQSNLVLSTDVVRIPQGYTNTPEAVTFSLPDGTSQSQNGIVIAPVVTNVSAAAIFTTCKSATVYVKNLSPVVIQPTGVWYRADPPYDRVVVGRPFTFNYIVKDVPADQESMWVRWSFGGGQSLEVMGATGQVTHTFSGLGRWYVYVQAYDKDGGASDEVEFGVNVIPVPPPPSVRILTPSGPLLETGTLNTGELTVQLSEAFTNAVAVGLTVTPANSAANGAVALATNQVVFAVGETNQTVRISLLDGTGISQTNGFTITPTVTGNAAAAAHYTVMTSGSVMITNASPVILYPFASEITEPVLFVVRRGEPWGFNWSVSDVALDLPSLSVRWDFGDGDARSLSGGSGFVAHTYSASGDRTVRLVVTDKDGGEDEVTFMLRVIPPTDGFVLWMASKGLSGDPTSLFAFDHDGDGIANGFEYAFGTNLTEGVPLLNIRMVNGHPNVETPRRDPESTGDVSVTVEGCTNLFSGDWSLPMGPSAQSGKPDNRDWYAPLVTMPGTAFFRLRAVWD